jgi:hypothetical protein
MNDNIYTSLEEAGEEIRRRWQDQALRKRVEEYLGGDIPEPFREEPRAVLFRNIASPDIEFCHFVEQANRIGVKPLALEYTHDRFCTQNADKICLAKLAIFNGRNKHGGAIVSYKKVIDLKGEDNKRFCEINTLWGQNLVDFHHDLLRQQFPEIEICDVSMWSHFKERCAAEYYQYFLALFAYHGILFENFITSEEEAVFSRAVVIPAFEFVEKRIGVKPIVVAIVAEEMLDDPYWWCYDARVVDMLS